MEKKIVMPLEWWEKFAGVVNDKAVAGETIEDTIIRAAASIGALELSDKEIAKNKAEALKTRIRDLLGTEKPVFANELVTLVDLLDRHYQRSMDDLESRILSLKNLTDDLLKSGKGA